MIVAETPTAHLFRTYPQSPLFYTKNGYNDSSSRYTREI